MITKLEDIPQQFVDVDFRGQERYVFGEKPSDEVADRFRAMKDYESVRAPIPSSQWVELAREIENAKTGLEWLVKWILNQGQEGSCVGNMKTQQNHVAQAKQFGFDNVIPLSAVSLYQLIGSSPGSGAWVPDSMEAGHDVGYVPLDTPENRERFGAHVMPPRGFYTKRPQGCETTAAFFKDDEQYAVRTYEGMVTALLCGDSCGIGRDGHSILYAGVRFKTDSVNSIWIPYPNSWNYDWGFAFGNTQGGWGADTYSRARKAAGYCVVQRTAVSPAWRFAKK